MTSNESISKQVQETIVDQEKNQGSQSKKALSNFEKASAFYNELILKGITRERGYNLLAVNERQALAAKYYNKLSQNL